jgi:hypothetical protein
MELSRDPPPRSAAPAEPGVPPGPQVFNGLSHIIPGWLSAALSLDTAASGHQHFQWSNSALPKPELLVLVLGKEVSARGSTAGPSRSHGDQVAARTPGAHSPAARQGLRRQPPLHAQVSTRDLGAQAGSAAVAQLEALLDGAASSIALPYIRHQVRRAPPLPRLAHPPVAMPHSRRGTSGPSCRHLLACRSARPAARTRAGRRAAWPPSHPTCPLPPCPQPAHGKSVDEEIIAIMEESKLNFQVRAWRGRGACGGLPPWQQRGQQGQQGQQGGRGAGGAAAAAA